MPLRRPLRTLVLPLCGALTTALLLAPPAHSLPDEQVWRIHGTDGLVARVALAPGPGSLTLAVERHGRTVLEPSPLGLLTERADLSRGLRPVSRSSRTVVERYRTTTGKSRDRRTRLAETRWGFRTADGTRLDLTVRVAPDGVAYRYTLPDTGATGTVTGESSAFVLPAGSDSWLGRYRADNENLFTAYPAAAAPTGEYMMQSLFRTPGGHALIAESGLTGAYAGARLTHTAGSPVYGVRLWDARIAVDGGRLDTPWRAVITGDPARITRSTLIDDLAPASRVRDTSWVRPGPALWTWLAGGRPAGQSLPMQKAYADYAAARGWPYTVVDAGWYFDPRQWDVTDPEWERNSWIPELVRYGAARGVGVHVWIHYRDLDTAQERERWLPVLHRWGVKGVKIDFMDSESQDRLRWYDEILPATAEHRLLVNFHGSTIPKGMQRTWPHVMTLEGVNGEEKRVNTAEHLTILPFTRNVIGSMDFTPGSFHRPARPNAASDAGELGLAVLYESGVQNLSGTPESYDARPEARRFLERLPAAWDETRLLTGAPGTLAVLARRAGPRWFLGAIQAGPARTVEVPLRIGRGRWLVETVTDGPSGLRRETRPAHGGATLTLPVVADGGFAATACRWHPGRTSC
ncbi:glycoside hydrolase family 97 catalytic domain-containing protein [Streptomyces clavuligerus]|nr:glycoside hydrolase family 97 protein [Streptomyces clavuligerus]ANW17914.1 alpha-galactosidase [Streptomyces clavuligerus]AXU12470.1 alpha-galactosidase [Streptomyces clavuligerus]MBY6302362.1 glycoside hydrolase family 97 catalytic domain-containing protein [Streptomyces clavuligerus]QCS05252.1 alpha-galactosidase [Streptomyces clavuligerus]QPJ95379.1 alpha-galactosidase [Streptomyces clavuligerus]